MRAGDGKDSVFRRSSERGFRIAPWRWAALYGCGALLAISAFGQEAASLEEVLARADGTFARRYVEEEMIDAIALYEAAVALLAPSEIERQAFVLNRLAQLCYEATTFSPGDTEEDRLLFERGRAAGLESLRLNPDYATIEDDDFRRAVSHVSDAAALLWTANNWGGLLGMSPIEGLLHVGKVRALYERCLEVDEAYWGASAHNALGAMLVVTPGPFGGDPDAGIAHLERAVSLAPDYQINRVVRAQYLGFRFDLFGRIAAVRDAEFIEAELSAVLAGAIEPWPFWNREAAKEAEALLAILVEMSP